jgi:hypothetical protein
MMVKKHPRLIARASGRIRVATAGGDSTIERGEIDNWIRLTRSASSVRDRGRNNARYVARESDARVMPMSKIISGWMQTSRGVSSRAERKLLDFHRANLRHPRMR